MINNNFIGKSNINSTCLGRKLELQYVANFEVKQRQSLSLLQRKEAHISYFLIKKARISCCIVLACVLSAFSLA